MAPGKRKSPFIGLVETSDEPVLYKRYTDASDVLLEKPEKKHKKNGEAKNGATDHKSASKGTASTGTDKALENMTREELLSLLQAHRTADQPPADIPPTKRPKKRSNTSEAVTDCGDVPSIPKRQEDKLDEKTNPVIPAPVERVKKKEKKGKKAKEQTPASAKGPSGPGNAAEADRMRSIMGIRKDRPSAAKPANGFSFAFKPDLEGASQSDKDGSEEIEAEAAVSDAGDGENDEAGQEESEARRQSGKAASSTAPEQNSDPHLDAKLKRVLGQKNEHVARRVFVGGMPFTYDEEEVREFWSYCGEIESVDLMRFPDTGRFKGIAFITFAEEAGYREALKCNGEYIDEQRLKVEPCISAGPKANSRSRKAETGSHKSAFSSPAPKTPGYHVAYVGNLAFDANQKQLKEVFEGCNVTIIRLHTDKDTGKSKGYAHVHFADEESLDRAVQANGRMLLGRAIKVGYAQPKKE